MSSQAHVNVRADHGRTVQCQVNVISRSSQVKVRIGQVISSSKYDQIRTSHDPVKVR